MAQLVEQLIRNEQVVGSSPTISSKTCVNTAFSQVFLFQNRISKFNSQQKISLFFYALYKFSLFSISANSAFKA